MWLNYRSGDRSVLREVSACFLQPSAATLFEQACSDRIQQLDDADSDEDLWDEKEITFSSSARPRSVTLTHDT